MQWISSSLQIKHLSLNSLLSAPKFLNMLYVHNNLMRVNIFAMSNNNLDQTEPPCQNAFSMVP